MNCNSDCSKLVKKSDERLSKLELIILGNGIKGLADRVEIHETRIDRLESYILVQKGQIKLLRWVFGAAGLNTVLFLVKAFLP